MGRSDLKRRFLVVCPICWTKLAKMLLFLWTNALVSIYVTRRVAVYLETHCNIGSKRAFTTGVLDNWHNYLLIYWRTSCLVPAFDDSQCYVPATEWCQHYLPCYLLPVSNSVCFSSIYRSLGRTRRISMALRHISTAAYYWTISDNGRCRKFG